jgi:hypothetical protein
LSEWKARADFWSEVEKRRVTWGRERTPDVVLALYKRLCATGGAAEVRLWFQLIEGWSDRVTVKTSGYDFANDRMTEEEIDAAIAEADAFFKKVPKRPKAL